MPDFELVPRRALAFAPVRAPGGDLVLEACAEGRIVQALAGARADPGEIAARLVPIGDGAPHAVRAYAPGQWFVVSDAPLAVGALRASAEAVGADIALFDQSHGRVRVSLEGSKARHVLAKGTGVDLSDRSFAQGRSAQTLFGHIGIHLTRVAADRFELIVLRSFADSLWEELAEAGAGPR